MRGRVLRQSRRARGTSAVKHIMETIFIAGAQRFADIERRIFDMGGPSPYTGKRRPARSSEPEPQRHQRVPEPCDAADEAEQPVLEGVATWYNKLHRYNDKL